MGPALSVTELLLSVVRINQPENYVRAGLNIVNRFKLWVRDPQIRRS